MSPALLKLSAHFVVVKEEEETLSVFNALLTARPSVGLGVVLGGWEASMLQND